MIEQVSTKNFSALIIPKQKQKFVIHRRFKSGIDLIEFYDDNKIRPVIKKSNIVHGKKETLRRKFLDCCNDECTNYSLNKKPCFRVDVKHNTNFHILYVSKNHIDFNQFLSENLAGINKIESKGVSFEDSREE